MHRLLMLEKLSYGRYDLRLKVADLEGKKYNEIRSKGDIHDKYCQSCHPLITTTFSHFGYETFNVRVLSCKM